MAAEDGIEAAVTAYAQAEGWQGVVTGWVMLVSTHEYDGDQERSGVATIYPNGSMPWPHALGIVEAARLRMHHDFLGGEP